MVILAAPALFAQAPPAFEVASVKPSAPNQRGYGIVPEANGLKGRNVPVPYLIAEAFGVQSFQLAGLPQWANSARYDIDAKTTAAQVSKRQLRQMLESLLADRFQLTYHRETRDLPVYSLIPARSGPKLKRVENQDGPHGVDFRDGGLIIIGRGATMEEFAEALSFRVGRHVVDRTGIQGRYDFRIEFTPDEAVPRFGAESPAAGDPDGSSLFTALQEHAGLRLQGARGPVEIVAVDRLERPAAN